MQKNKGISLIVLVITIIVMTILAGAVIITLENTGIIKRSKQATNNNNYADEMTRLTLIKNGILTDNLGKITLDEYITELQNKGIIEPNITTNSDGTKIVKTNTGFEVTLSQNGTSDIEIIVNGHLSAGNNGSDSSGNNNENGNATVIYKLSGLWKFKDTINYNGLNDFYPINFTMKDMSGSEIGVFESDSALYYTLYWEGLRSDENVYTYMEGEWVNYISSSEYSIEEIKTIDLGSTSQEVSEEFYIWFTANATRQS
ncbi:MAG: hypothetical protein IKL68_06220 [Clostridia bacterium]|nr:hypothetical protein [Clostridia bacterium]